MSFPLRTDPNLPGLLMPLMAGMVYVLGALFLKRAADLGADVWRTTRSCNHLTALVFAPLVWLGGTIPSWFLWWQPAVVALLFMAGQVLTLLALKVGDVSIATPVLGVKILLVALLVTVLAGEPVGMRVWVAAFLSTGAIALLNFTRSLPHHRVGLTIVLAVAGAVAFALFDVLVQVWAPLWGAGRFLPIMMVFVALGSLLLRPWAAARGKASSVMPATARIWVGCGASCLALQAIMMVSFIALHGQAAVANVLYSGRGLWSVLAVWWVGGWFANRERYHGGRILAWRLTGAMLLMIAILIVLWDAGADSRATAGGVMNEGAAKRAAGEENWADGTMAILVAGENPWAARRATGRAGEGPATWAHAPP